MATVNPLTINPGDLRHAISILEPAPSTDSSGSAITWTTFLSTRAKLEPIRAMDLIRSGQDVTQIYITATIRFHAGVTSAMRVQTASSTYIIQAIENVLERNRILRLTCLALGGNE